MNRRNVYIILLFMVIVSGYNCSNECPCDNIKVIRKYYENGNLKAEFSVNDSLLIDEYYKKYDEKGNLIGAIFFQNNKKHGPEIQYYVDGSLKGITNFCDGVAEGKTIWFYNNGQIEKIDTYYNDTLNGISHVFYENGLLKVTYYRKNGKNSGEQYLYYNNGVLKKYSYIVDGNQIYYRKYDRKANFIKEEGEFPR